MSIGRQVLSAVSLTVFSAVLCAAQNITASHSGTVHYFEGDVSIDGTKLVQQVARFSDLKEQSVLKTGLGRAEILLTPGVFLRVSENSAVKMLDNRLISTRVELLSGDAMVEALESGTSVRDPAVTIVYKDFSAQPVKLGVFEITSQPSQLKVFKGEAKVFGNGTSVNVKDGNLIDLTITMATAKFDSKSVDDLYLWSRDRSAYMAAANMSSASTLSSSASTNCNGFVSSACTGGFDPRAWRGFSGGWYYNPYLHMYSYIPFGGSVYSPFGYGYYNPYTIAYFYNPGYYWPGSGGARTGTTTGLPLSSVPSMVTSTTQLPRLGMTATLRPTLSSPARGSEAGDATSAMSTRSTGLSSFNNFPGISPINNSSVNNSVSSPSPVMSAPQMSAPAPAPAPVSTTSAGGTVGAIRGR